MRRDRKPLSPAVWNRIEELLRWGMPPKDIARKYSIKKMEVIKYADKKGIFVKPEHRTVARSLDAKLKKGLPSRQSRIAEAGTELLLELEDLRPKSPSQRFNSKLEDAMLKLREAIGGVGL